MEVKHNKILFLTQRRLSYYCSFEISNSVVKSLLGIGVTFFKIIVGNIKNLRYFFLVKNKQLTEYFFGYFQTNCFKHNCKFMINNVSLNVRERDI